MKIEEQVLSRKQMAHLVELGVDTSDASMYWIRAERMEGFRKHNLIDNDLGEWRLSLSCKLIVPAAWKVEYIPTYTIGDLIEKLPKRNDEGSYFNIKLGDKTLSCAYTDVFVYYAEYNNLIDGLYNYLCWVAKYHKELIK